MINNSLKEEYFEHNYELLRLLSEKKEQLEILSEDEFGIQIETRNQKGEHILAELDQKIQYVEKSLESICIAAKESGVELSFEKLAEKYNLNREEKYILMALFLTTISSVVYRRQLTGSDLLYLVGYKPKQFITKGQLIRGLMEKELIDTPYPGRLRGNTIFEARFGLTKNALKDIAWSGMLIEPAKTTGSFEDKIEGLLVIREPVTTFDQIVLDNEKKEVIERALFQTENAKKLFEEWGFNQTIKYGKGTVMLFYGPPGTGKTATCEAIAARLDKKLGIANYANIHSRWLGDSEKNITAIFDEAKTKDCVLIFDEAEALFGQRLPETYSTDRMYNIMTNILMQVIEQFDGVVILTTNREIVIDEAFERRILLKLKFEMPKAEERTRIWQAFFTEKAPLSEDVNFVELGKRFELSGGEIKNVVLKAVSECAYRGEKITMAVLVHYAIEELGTSVRKKEKLGFVH
jgi:AAA+ superfamily predicted ATPase